MKLLKAIFRSTQRRLLEGARALAGRRQSLPMVGGKVCFDLRSTPNSDWSDTARGYTISSTPQRLLDNRSTIFAMGSCFAVEIRAALRSRGFDVFPRYKNAEFDRSQIVLDRLPEHDNINHYNTFVIRHEFERALSGERISREELYQQPAQRSFDPFQGRDFFGDPYRRNIVGIDADHALEASRKIDDCIWQGIRESSLFIITLGLIETWRDSKTGRVIWGTQRNRAKSEAMGLQFHLSDFVENYQNMRRVCEVIAKVNPSSRVVLTVSPVALQKTFTDRDVVVANVESKSVLRAVAGQLSREFDHVSYWPSYEIATRQDVYCEDGRHVSREAVGFIVDNFLKVYAKSA